MSSNNPGTSVYDSLVSDSSIRLFGRPTWDIVLRTPAAERNSIYDGPTALPPRNSANGFLVEQLKRDDAMLALISAFSYQNQLFDLPKPAIFLVHGPGTDVEGDAGLKPENSGLTTASSQFSSEIKVWLYDRADYTLRLDSESGTLERLILDQEAGGIPAGAMHSGDGDDVARPRWTRGRRRWRGAGD